MTERVLVPLAGEEGTEDVCEDGGGGCASLAAGGAIVGAVVVVTFEEGPTEAREEDEVVDMARSRAGTGTSSRSLAP